MSNFGKIISINISEKKGEIKHRIENAVIDNTGIVCDAHAGNNYRQVSLLSKEKVDAFGKEFGEAFNPGAFAENILFDGLDIERINILDCIVINNEIILEITQIGKKCHGDNCAVFKATGKCIMPSDGLFCRVVSGGKINIGDALEYKKRKITVGIITLSDRASAGKYPDLSGEKAKEIIEIFLKNHGWDVEIKSILIPDDSEKLSAEILELLKRQFNIIFTLGSTGIGSRDIAPDAVAALCDKYIPGVMEYIKTKYGNEKPSALLSRSIAGIKNKTQIYTLPGSVKAVTEYLNEILKVVEHAIFMINDFDVHQSICITKWKTDNGKNRPW